MVAEQLQRRSRRPRRRRRWRSLVSGAACPSKPRRRRSLPPRGAGISRDGRCAARARRQGVAVARPGGSRAAGRRGRGRRGRARSACRRCGRWSSAGSAGPLPPRSRVRWERPSRRARKPVATGTSTADATRRRGELSRAPAVAPPRSRRGAPAPPPRVPRVAPRPASANPRSAHRPGRARATMIGKIQHLLPLGLRRRTGLQLMDKKTTRRGNYESGSDYVLEYGELRFAFNEEDFGQRVEQAAVKLGFVDQGLSRRGARRPPRPRRQRRDRRAQLAPRRAHQRELGGPGRPRQPQPRPLAPPPRLPRRLARPAGQGGRARRRLRRAHPDLRLRPAGPQLRADRALQRALLAPHRLPRAERAYSERSSAATTVSEPLPAAVLAGVEELLGRVRRPRRPRRGGSGSRPGGSRLRRSAARAVAWARASLAWRGLAGGDDLGLRARRASTRRAPRGWGRSAARPGREQYAERSTWP